MKANNNITSKQMGLFTFITQTAMGIIALPRVLAEEVGHDGWISILIAGLIAVILSALIAVLLRRYSNKGIYEINKLIFGRAIGYVFNILLMIYLLFAAAISVRIFSIFLRLTLLPQTPPLVITPVILLPSIYLVWYGLKYVCRFKYITPMSYVTALIFLILIFKEYRFSFLKPIGEAGLSSILYSLRRTFYAFTGIELIAFLYPEVTDKNDALKWHVIACSGSIVFYIIVVTASTALFGENLLQTLTIPLFNMSRVYHAPILERVDLYIIALWFVAMGCSMRAYMFAAYYSIQKVLKLENSKFLLISYFTVLVGLSRIPRDINQAFSLRENINLAGIGTALFLIFCLFLSFFRKKGVMTG